MSGAHAEEPAPGWVRAFVVRTVRPRRGRSPWWFLVVEGGREFGPPFGFLLVEPLLYPPVAGAVAVVAGGADRVTGRPGRVRVGVYCLRPFLRGGRLGGLCGAPPPHPFEDRCGAQGVADLDVGEGGGGHVAILSCRAVRRGCGRGSSRGLRCRSTRRRRGSGGGRRLPSRGWWAGKMRGSRSRGSRRGRSGWCGPCGTPYGWRGGGGSVRAGGRR